jgi:hypothetical protein
MKAAFRRNLVLGTLGLGACTMYEPSLLIGFAGAPSVGGSSSASGGRGDGGTGVAGSVPSGASGTGGSSGGSFGGAGNAGGKAGTRGSAGSSGNDAAAGEAGASGDGSGGEAGDSAGAGEGGASAPRAGSGGSGGSGGGETCTGCARLSAPLTSSPTVRSHFVISLSGGPDFTGATLHFRVFLHAGTAGQFTAYLQDASGFTYEAIGAAALGSLTGWQDLSWVVMPTGSDFDVTDIQLLGIELAGAPGAISPTVLYVDSITVPSLALAFNFDDATTVMEGPQTAHLSDQRMWLNSDSEVGSSLSWLGD